MLAKCISYAIQENEKHSISCRWIYYQLRFCGPGKSKCYENLEEQLTK